MIVLRRLFILCFMGCVVSAVFAQTSEIETPKKIIISAPELRDDHASSFLDIVRVEENSSAPSLAALLSLQKGLTIRQHASPGSAATLNIRGVGAGKAEQVLVLLDGIRLNTARGLGVDLSQIPLSIIEKIEVIRGGESALYGADAVGGVINIVTRHTPTTLDYKLFRNSWNTDTLYDHRLSLRTARQMGPARLSLITHSEKNEGAYDYRNPLTFKRDRREGSQLFSRGFLLKADWAIHSKLSLSIQEEFFHSKQRLIAPLMPDGKAPTASTARQNNLRTLTTLKGLWRLSDERLLSLQIPVRLNRYVYNDAPLKSVYKDTHLGPKLDYSFALSDQHALHLVGESTIDTLKSLSHVQTPRKVNWAAAIKDDYFVSPQLTLSGALRFDYAKEIYGALTPKLGARYELSPRMTLKSNLSRSFRSPTFNERFFVYHSPAYSFTGNPALKPESAWDADFGFIRQGTFWKMEQAFFVSHIQNLIVEKATGPFHYSMDNLEQGTIWGRESSFEAKLPYFKHLTGVFNYTWLKTRLPHRPQHTLNTTLKWEKQRASVFVTHQYVSTIKTDQSYSRKIPITQLLNAGFSWPLSEKTRISAQIENCMDRPYERVAYFPMPGRTWSISISGTL